MPEHDPKKSPDLQQHSPASQDEQITSQPSTIDFAALRRAIELPNPQTLTPGTVMQLQRTIGNQAVQRLLVSQGSLNPNVLLRSDKYAKMNFGEDDSEEETNTVDKEGTGLNSGYLYRAGAKSHLQDMVDNQKVPKHNGFYSPKDTYSNDYLQGSKNKSGNYEAMIAIKLKGTFYEVINDGIDKRVLHFQNVGNKERKEVFTNYKKSYQPKKKDELTLKFEENVYNITAKTQTGADFLNGWIESITFK